MVTAAVLLCAPQATAAGVSEEGHVVLRLKGGGFEISGMLRAFDGANYVIESGRHGRMTLNAQRYECIGAACASAPSAATLEYERLYPERAETVVVKGPDGPATNLLPALLGGYAEAAGMNLVPVAGGGAGMVELRLVDDASKRLATIKVVRGATGSALAALRDGEAGLTFADRAASSTELRQLQGEAPRSAGGRTDRPLGHDGLAVIVSRDNPLPSISFDALARILAGEVADWYELGLPPGPIRVNLRDETSAAAALVTSELLEPRGKRLAASHQRHASEAELSDAVARDRQAIGLVSMSAVRSARPVNLLTSCGLLLRATRFNIKAGEYPLAMPIAIHAPTPPKEAAARGLLRYLASPGSAAVVDRAGFVSNAVSSIDLASQAERLAHATNAQGEAFDLNLMREMLGDLKTLKRLSLTFRLATGTRDADGRAKADAERLARLLQTGELKGKRILLAGFTDVDGGKFQANLSHSFKRANFVRQLVLSAGGSSLDAKRIQFKGYGPLAPIACNDTAEGRALNRRVEVWVEDAAAE